MAHLKENEGYNQLPRQVAAGVMISRPPPRVYFGAKPKLGDIKWKFEP